VVEVDEYVGEDHEAEDEGGRFAPLEAFSDLFLHSLTCLLNSKTNLID